MKDTHTLTRHRDIQNWVSDNKGIPAIARVRDNFGDMKSRLCLSFERRQRENSELELDDGMSPVSWTAWLAELDRQQLALKVSGRDSMAFEFVERHGAFASQLRH
ncbi:hypothetical protein [Devosia sp.]|uniref:hypothetical protein n=1 Tax=Devosia sp. TaxID=1871048 RepID=UPI003266E519